MARLSGLDLNAREGYPIPYPVSVASSSLVAGDGLARKVLVAPDGDGFRNDEIDILNLRVEKKLTFDRDGLTLGIDAFDLTNDNKALQREGFLSAQSESFRDADGDPAVFSTTQESAPRVSIAVSYRPPDFSGGLPSRPWIQHSGWSHPFR